MEIFNNKYVLTSKLFSFLIIVLVYSASVEASYKRKVCIIGAGQAGLSTARFLSQHKDEFEIVIFEKAKDIGGQWLYTEDLVDQFNMSVHSSVYKKLITNGPAELQTYPDYRYNSEFSTVQPRQSVLQYLRNFTHNFDLHQYIRFNTLVTKITPLVGKGGNRNAQWLVQYKKPHSKVVNLTKCDAVAVCNGHVSKGKVPKISGIETYPGIVMHSHFYRKPEDYTNKTVLVLGAQFSGVDITLELYRYAKKIYLSHNKAKINGFQPNIVQISGLVAANGSTLILKDGSTVNDVDAVIFATGFLVDYPFLNEESGISTEKNYVSPLWRHIVNAHYPTMGFITLRYCYNYWAASYTQAQYFTNVLLGKVSLPSTDVMLKEIEKETPEIYKGRLDSKYQWELEDLLVQDGGIEPTPDIIRNANQEWLSIMLSDWAYFKHYFIRIQPETNQIDIYTPKKLRN